MARGGALTRSRSCVTVARRSASSRSRKATLAVSASASATLGAAGGSLGRPVAPQSRCAQRCSRAPACLRQPGDEGAAAARRQFLEIRFDRRGIVEAIQALAVGAQLADRLRAAQHEHRQQARRRLSARRTPWQNSVHNAVRGPRRRKFQGPTDGCAVLRALFAVRYRWRGSPARARFSGCSRHSSCSASADRRRVSSFPFRSTLRGCAIRESSALAGGRTLCHACSILVAG
jgi:hypothetical protein